MKNKKPKSKWIKAIVILLVGSLIYAVYFTELGKPETSESDQQISMYDQTAAPTLFVKWQQVPTVRLDWAYADQNLLKFSLKIHDLGTNIDPADWICNPYITMDKPIPRRLSGYQMRTVYDTLGEFIQATYEYEINAGGYDSLAIEMDVTIGPCADYLNFQESNVTPEVIPELVGNYHLSFQVPIKSSTPLPSKNTPALTIWNGISIYPGARELRNEKEFYFYSVQDSPKNVEAFYEDKMASEGWKNFNRSEMKINNDQEVQLYYSRSENIIMISIGVPREDKPTTVLVSLVQ